MPIEEGTGVAQRTVNCTWVGGEGLLGSAFPRTKVGKISQETGQCPFGEHDLNKKKTTGPLRADLMKPEETKQQVQSWRSNFRRSTAHGVLRATHEEIFPHY